VRRLCVVLLIAVMAVSAGCVTVPVEARRIVHENAVLQGRLVELLDAGQVSEEALDANARANAENWARLDALMGD